MKDFWSNKKMVLRYYKNQEAYKKLLIFLSILKLFLLLFVINIILITISVIVINNVYTFDPEIIRDFCSGVSDCWYGFASGVTNLAYWVMSSVCLFIVSIASVKKRNFYNRYNIILLFFVVGLFILRSIIIVSESVDYTKSGVSGYISCLESNFKFHLDSFARGNYCDRRFKKMDIYENNSFYLKMKDDINFITENNGIINSQGFYESKRTFVDYQYRQNGTLEKEVHYNKVSNDKLFEKVFDKEGKYVEDWILYFDL